MNRIIRNACLLYGEIRQIEKFIRGFSSRGVEVIFPESWKGSKGFLLRLIQEKSLRSNIVPMPNTRVPTML